jgi:hypothetical protein
LDGPGKENWQALVGKLSDAMQGLNLHVPNIDLIKTSGVEEFGGAYTRRHAVMLPESWATSLPMTDFRRAYFLLAHETFHVLSRTDSHLRDDLYALLGFKTVDGFEYPAELEDRRISNPDSFEYLHTLTVQAGSESVDVMPVIQSLLPLTRSFSSRILSRRMLELYSHIRIDAKRQALDALDAARRATEHNGGGNGDGTNETELQTVVEVGDDLTSQSRHSLLLRGSPPAGKLLIPLARRDVRVVEGARLESEAGQQHQATSKRANIHAISG